MKVLVLSSGGIDSSTCLGLAVKEYGKENVVALSIFYGQKHDKELKASDAVANYYGVEHIKLNLSSIFDYRIVHFFHTLIRKLPTKAMRNRLRKQTESL